MGEVFFMKICKHVDNSSMFVSKKYQFFYFFYYFLDFIFHEGAYELTI